MKNKCNFENIMEIIKSMAAENCKKCTPCREGFKWLGELMESSSNHKNKEEQFMAFIGELSQHIHILSSCDKGRDSAMKIRNYIISDNNHDILFHIQNRECRHI